MTQRFGKLGFLLGLLPLGFLGLFYFYPLSRILSYSLVRLPESGVEAFWQVLSGASTWRIAWFTFWQAALSTFLTLIVGLPGAYLFARYKFRGKSLLQALTTIPFILPTLVVAAAFNALLGPRGWVNLGLMALLDLSSPPIQFMNTLTAILVAHVFYNTTIVLRTVSSFWTHLDPRLEQAARVLGASRLQTFLRITMPLLAPAVAVACLLVFIFDFTSFGVILVLGGARFATLEVAIYTQALSFLNLPQAAALSLLQLFFTLGFTAAYLKLSNRISQPISLRPQSVTQQRLTTWKSRLSALLIGTILMVLLVTPLVALAFRSITAIEPAPTGRGFSALNFSLASYQALSENRRQSLFYVSPLNAVSNSLGYAALTIILSLSIGMPAAWVLAQRSGAHAARLLDIALMLPLGTSSVTLGLGFILALNRPPLNLRTSTLLIPLAHTLVALPFVVRNLVPTLRSIRPSLRQAASVLGASPFEVIRYVDLPLVSRALLVAATFAFTISLGEFGATAVIARPEYPTIPIAIYRFLGQPGVLNYGQALALSTVLMLVCMGGMLLIEKLRLAEYSEF